MKIQKIFLFQIPKNFNLRRLDGKQISLDELEGQLIKEEDMANPDERAVIERVEAECEDYVTNQVLIGIPGKENQLKLKKKFAKVFRVYKSYKIKKIKKGNVIRTKPVQFVFE